MLRRIAWVALLVASTLPHNAQTASKKPPVPPGAPTRAFAVALLSGGIDYLRPGIAAKLARDGEGVVIGFDAIDGDMRPFLRDGPATRLVEMSPTLLAPFRLDLTSTASWAQTLAVLIRTPARVAVVAAPPSHLITSGPWDAPMATLPDVLFIVPADDAATVPATAANVIVIAALSGIEKSGVEKSGVEKSGIEKSGVDLILAPAAATREAPLGGSWPTTALEAAILLPGVFACIDLRGARSPADVRQALLAKAAKGPPGSPPLLGLCR